MPDHRADQRQTVAYVSCAETREIQWFALEQSPARLTQLGTIVIPGEGPSVDCMSLVVSPDRRFLYVASRAQPSVVATLAIDPANGDLSIVSVVEMPDRIVYLATDRRGKWLLSAYFDGNVVSSNAISPEGKIEAAANQTLTVQSRPHSVLANPTNSRVYVASYGADTIQSASFDADEGRIDEATVELTNTRVEAGPRHMAFGGDGRFLYVINQSDSTISTYGLTDTSGRLEEVDTLPIFGETTVRDGAASDVHVTADGRRLFASDRLTDALYGFSIDRDSGRLSPIGRISAEESPRGFAIDVAGSHLVCAGQTAGTVGLYSIDVESGALRFIARYPTGPNPNWVEMVDLPGD